MELINALVLIAGGILAISGLIVAKKPDARRLIDKLVPYQAGIGVALLALGVINLLRNVRMFDVIGIVPLRAIGYLAMCGTSILLGVMFGMPQIAKWLPGNATVEQQGMQLSKKLAPYQTMIGLIGLASALLMLLY